jgi:predicted metal-dependent TIM-barrel fold hydrolase
VEPNLAFFDAHLHADGLSDQDLRSMALFGLRGALLPARDAVLTRAKDLVAHFEELVHRQARRLVRLGIRPWAALGVHPARIPWLGLEQALAAIPRLAVAGRLVAIGEIGLELGGPREEQVFERQLALALELNLPVIVHTPERDKARLTRRALAILRASELAPESVLVDHVSPETVRLVRECGHLAGLSVNPMHLSAEQAVDVISRFGSEGLVVSSDAGDGARDILALPRTASLLDARGLSRQIARRVLATNALAFLRLEPEVVGLARERRRLGA